MKTRLRSGAILHFIIAIGHVACLFFLEEAFKAYDILDEMTSMCFGHTWLLYALTITLALAFTVVGLYALSAAGDIKRLPLQRFVIIAIVVVYSIRAVLGLGSLLWDFSWLNLFSLFIVCRSVLPSNGSVYQINNAPLALPIGIMSTI